VPRTIIWWAIKRDPSAQLGFLEGAGLGPPRLLVKTSAPVIWGAAKMNDSYDDTVRETIAKIAPALQRIEAWMDEGVLDGEQLNAADFQIATSLSLLMCFEDIAPAIASRPAGKLAIRVVPNQPGHIRAVFPAEWLASLDASPATTAT
jgi:glutathione S-transferase